LNADGGEIVVELAGDIEDPHAPSPPSCPPIVIRTSSDLIASMRKKPRLFTSR
jgi:hypothetical protein